MGLEHLMANTYVTKEHIMGHSIKKFAWKK